MGQIKTGKFIGTGAAINLDLGFIPAYARIHNMNAGAGEVFTLEYFNQNGDSAETWIYCINDAGSAVAADRVKKASGGYLAEYDSVSVGNQKSVTFDAAGGAAANLITCSTASDVPANGDVLKFVDGGDIAAGLNELSVYYVIDSETYGSGTFRVSTTSPQTGAAQSAAALTDDGSGSNYFINVSNSQEADVTGGKGLTISASFQSDSDVLYFIAIEADRDQNLGDAVNF